MWRGGGGVELVSSIDDFRQHFYTTSVAPGRPRLISFKLAFLADSDLYEVAFTERITSQMSQRKHFTLHGVGVAERDLGHVGT